MFKNSLNYKLLNMLILVAIVYIGISTIDFWSGFIDKVLSVIVPFVIAFAIAYSFYPIVVKLEKKGVRKGIAVGAITLIIFCLIVLLFSITIPLVYEQLISLSKTIGQVITDISTKFDWNLGNFENTINETLNTIIRNLGTYISNGTMDLLGKSVDFFTRFIIVAIVSIYFLFDMDKIRLRASLLLKKKNTKSYNYVKAVDNELQNYLEGLVTFMVIQLVEYSFLFWIVGHPNWLLLGILACLTTVIPYFGGLITNIIAVILASVISTKVFIATLIICLIFPNVDGYIISPRVYGKTNNINPVWTIFAIFASGVLFGLVGIVIALPLYIIINCTYNFFKKDIYGKIDFSNK